MPNFLILKNISKNKQKNPKNFKWKLFLSVSFNLTILFEATVFFFEKYDIDI